MPKKIIFFILLFFVSIFISAQNNYLPNGFVYIDEIIPNITVELRYAGENNFIGSPIDGYETEKCIISTDAAYALKRIQIELNKFGLGLKIFDAYRPQRAVDHFMRWAKDTIDVKMKEQYYPTQTKAQLFEQEYIAEKSGHSRGSTVDLTIINSETSEELDMGSPYDLFNEKSHVLNKNLSAQQKANRMLLNKVMIKNGFSHYSKEWWHFTLKNEPFPDTYFDFVVK